MKKASCFRGTSAKETLTTVFRVLESPIIALKTKPINIKANRILIVENGKLGDMMYSIGLITAIHQQAPHIQIDIVASNKNHMLVKKDSRITNIFIDEASLESEYAQTSALKKTVQLSINDTLTKRLITKLKKNKYDVLFLRYPTKRNCLFAKSIMAKKIIGYYYSPLSSFYLDSIPKKRKSQGIQGFQGHLIAAGFKPIFIDPLLKGFPKVKKSTKKTVIGINTAYGGTMPRKYPDQRWISIINELGSKKNTNIVLFGMKEDIERNKTIAKKVNVPIINLTNALTINKFIEELQKLDCLITVEGGASHIAGGLRIPQVVLFSYTPIEAWGFHYKEYKPIRFLANKGYCKAAYNCKLDVCIAFIPEKEILKNTYEVLEGKHE